MKPDETNKQIAELKNVNNFFLGFVEHLAAQKLTEEMDDDLKLQADYEGGYNIIVKDAREYLRVVRRAMEKK